MKNILSPEPIARYRLVLLAVLAVLVLTQAALAQDKRLDLDGDGKPELVFLDTQKWLVGIRGGQSAEQPLKPTETGTRLGIEMVSLSARLPLLVITSTVGPRKCYQFFRYQAGKLTAVPVETLENITDNAICAQTGARPIQVRYADLDADGTSELIHEQTLSAGPVRALQRRAYRFEDDSWAAAGLLSGTEVNGVPVLTQLDGTYLKESAISALADLQDLQELRLNPVLSVVARDSLPGYRLSLKTPVSEVQLAVIRARRSVALAQGEQVLTLEVQADGPTGRLVYDSATDLADPPLVLSGLGKDFDGVYRPAPYNPQWPNPESYLAGGVLAGVWSPAGNLGLVTREVLRIDRTLAAGTVELSLRPGKAYTVSLAGLNTPYDLALLSSQGNQPLLIDLKGPNFLQLVSGRCTADTNRGMVCTPTGNAVLYRRRNEI